MRSPDAAEHSVGLDMQVPVVVMLDGPIRGRQLDRRVVDALDGQKHRTRVVSVSFQLGIRRCEQGRQAVADNQLIGRPDGVDAAHRVRRRDDQQAVISNDHA